MAAPKIYVRSAPGLAIRSKSKLTHTMLTLVVPTYNERDNLAALLQRIAAVRPRLPEPLEVLIVDSASPDGTAEQAHRLLSADGLGRVIELAAWGDFAHAAIEGFRHARGEVIGLMDADLSHPPELLPELLAAIRTGAEVAVASRYVAGGSVIKWPIHRRLLSRLGSLAARPLVPIHDATSGYFLCRAALVQSCGLRPQGFKVLMDILVQGCVHDVREVPYQFRDRVRGSSKLSGRVVSRYGAQLARLYRHRWRHPCRHVHAHG